MTGISYTVELKDDEARQQLEALIKRVEKREGFFANVGEHLMNSVKDNFENESGPDGNKWQALSPVTIALRLAKGNSPSPILRVSGDLVGSINYVASNYDVRVGTSKVYAAIQHFGGKAGRNKKLTIPARPYLGISDEDETVIMEIAEEWLKI